MNELARLATDSVGIRECVHLEKFPDGLFNKTFLFTMANGTKVVGKVPNPNPTLDRLNLRQQVR